MLKSKRPAFNNMETLYGFFVVFIQDFPVFEAAKQISRYNFNREAQRRLKSLWPLMQILEFCRTEGWSGL